ncbi:hypothetical protein Goshw_029418 [Gossypium schwendimanii]|uniref:Uncharacterized protein n=1 Tax=Gossypium schwendimanii TaxID=34291 RepID=A0A7J9LZA8_GOSSC|nr:hypothetical protein [Gossypium schwendimanii]
MSWSSLFSGMQPSIFLTSHCIQLHWPHSFPCPLLHPYCGARSDKARRKVIATSLRFITRQAIQLHSPSYVPLKTSCLLLIQKLKVLMLSTLIMSNLSGCMMVNESFFNLHVYGTTYVYLQLPDHDITLDAAWPELFMDRKGKYWEVPESISLDMSSLPSDLGLQYHFGIHKNSGHPQAFNALDGEAPSALMPGLCAKAAFSYQKSKDIWRRKETKEDLIIKTDKGSYWRPSYDVRLREPHAAISGIIGGTCAAWFGKGSKNVESQSEDNIPTTNNKRSPLSADFFGSACYTFQHGQFRKLYGDLTRVDARLDLSSLSSFAKRIFKSSSANKSLSSPRLNLIFQQQIAGPIVFRVDSKLLLDSKTGKLGPHIEDVIYSLSYSLRLLRSGKVVAWYSPKRKEGMIELRLFEF